jgi:hypothetical protein
MPAVTVGNAGLVFGLTAETIGLVQSFSETRNIEKVEARNAAGDISGLAYYNPTTAYSLSVAITGANTTLTVGGSFASIANASATAGSTRIDSIALNKTNTGFVTIDISATGYPNVT